MPTDHAADHAPPVRSVKAAGDDQQTEHSREARNVRIARGLSWKLLAWTIIFVMIAEVLIYLPSIGNFRDNWLRDRLAAAEVAALVLDAGSADMIPSDLEAQLLSRVGAMTIAVKRGNSRRLLAVSDMPPASDFVVDLRDGSRLGAITQALETLLSGGDKVIRAIGPLGDDPGDFVEISLSDRPLRSAMLGFSVNILLLSTFISAFTAALVYFTLTRTLVRPMRRLTRSVLDFAHAPEDPHRIIKPSGRSDEIGVIEEELSEMQRDLQTALKEKSRLAALGLAVSKINHDLRNILASAQLISDRLGMVEDPTVQRFAPKLLSTLDRAIEFCTSTLKYGSAHEAAPERWQFPLNPLVEEVAQAAGIEFQDGVALDNRVPGDIAINADPDQLFRVIMNIVRNAVQVLTADDRLGIDDVITISAVRSGSVVTCEISDTGPGIPEKAKAHLFEAFRGSVRPGGTGLGLAIAAELVRAHGGEIRLVERTLGATFQLDIPDPVVDLKAAKAGKAVKKGQGQAVRAS